MDHLAVPCIDSDVAHGITGIVCAGEKDEVSGPCVCRTYRSTLVKDSLGSRPGQVIEPAVGHHVAHKA